jgi:hypothetical protein
VYLKIKTEKKTKKQKKKERKPAENSVNLRFLIGGVRMAHGGQEQWPNFPKMTPRMELEEAKSWTATQKPSPSVITRMDIGNRIPSYCGNAPVHAARAHDRCVKTPNVKLRWKRGRKEFYGRGSRGAVHDKSGCGECCVC